ncbi:MAG: NUDIX domain-containing protein [Bacteroidota bacterium]
MPLTKWKTIRRESEIKNPWWEYRKDIVLLPSGKEGEYHYVHVAGSAMIIPIMPDGRIILVNQYRYLLDRESLEFPCGSINEGSSYDETALHELAEETGYSSAKMTYIGEHNPYNGVTDEISKIYVAEKPSPVHANPDETEEFEYVYVTVDELETKIDKGIIWDGMTLAAWSLARLKVRERLKGYAR